MRPLSEMDRRVIALHQSGKSINDIAAETGLKRATVRRVVECAGPTNAKGEAMLAADPESLEGLRLTGALSQRVYSAIAEATYKVDVPDLERLSDVAAQGRDCVARFPGIGRSVMTELDTLLARFGLTWNPRPRPFAWRTKENQHPLMKSWEDDRKRSEQEEKNAKYWNDIVRRVATIERVVGTAILENIQGRDSMQGISVRLAFLTGYLESRAEFSRKTAMRDITPASEQDDGGYETAGNLVCLPGVKLADVLDNGDRPPH